MKRIGVFLMSLCCVFAASAARADTASAAKAIFSAGSVDERNAALGELKAANYATAIYATGSIQFFVAL